MISAWQDQDFEGVAKLFDELWGWELEGSEQEKRDISDLYIAGSALACNRLRVIRENGDIAAYLGSVFYQMPAGAGASRSERFSSGCRRHGIAPA